MNCRTMREQIPELLAGCLEGAARASLVEHLDACPACRAEAAALETVWKGLEDMSEPEPGPAMGRRFQETLGAWREGFREGRVAGAGYIRPGAPARRSAAVWRWSWQAAAALLLARACRPGQTSPTHIAAAA